MRDETVRLAQFAAELRHDEVPQRVRSLALNLLVDQLGVQVGGAALPWSQQVRDTWRRPGGQAEATVVRYGDRLPLVATAFINSTFGHAFEYDDANRLAHGHIGAELIPAMLATAEREHVSGRELLTALVAAYEVRGRIGWALAPDLSERGGPQYSTTCGPFGAAAGVARLLGLGAAGIRNAMAIAGSFSGGLAQYDHGGGSVKRIYTAIACSHGIQSAAMAQAGMTGPDEILEGVHGLLHVYAQQFRPETLVAGLRETWTLEHVAFKAYSCSAPMHSAIDGLLALMQENALQAGEIGNVEVHYPKAVSRHVGISEPNDILGMQFSTAYSLALTAIAGGNTPLTYTEAARNDPRIRDFAARVSVHHDPDLEPHYQKHRPARVRITTRAGAVHERFTLDAKGSSARPMTDADIDAKFFEQTEPVLGRRSRALLERLRDFDSMPDAGAIFALLVEQPGR